MTFKAPNQAVFMFIFSLALGVTAVAAGEVKTLTASEIKKTFAGNTMDHTKVYVFWAPDGTIRGKAKQSDATDTGKYTISDDGIYCRAWDNWRGGSEQCGHIAKSGDEYARIVDGDVQSTFKILKGNPKGL